MPLSHEWPYADRIMAQPTFNLSGLNGGSVGPGSETITPSAALLAELAAVEST